MYAITKRRPPAQQSNTIGIDREAFPGRRKGEKSRNETYLCFFTFSSVHASGSVRRRFNASETSEDMLSAFTACSNEKPKTKKRYLAYQKRKLSFLPISTMEATSLSLLIDLASCLPNIFPMPREPKRPAFSLSFSFPFVVSSTK